MTINQGDLLLSNTMYDASDSHQKWVIYPDSYFKVGFDFLISILLMITCSLTPVYVAFPNTYTSNMMIIDNAMNIVFAIDIIINLFSAYYDEDFIIIDKKKVRLYQAHTCRK